TNGTDSEFYNPKKSEKEYLTFLRGFRQHAPKDAVLNTLALSDVDLQDLIAKAVLEALKMLRKKSDPQAEEIVPIEKLVGDAYSVIDKAVRAGMLHRNTGANGNSQLARRKNLVEIHHGWCTPAASEIT
ncbi:hypothetical protein PIB30_106764, partial [Stylosanthes scabra]|nr:hypothetical protein [Stylosanthes scabra]